jgi:hypothetical protein
VPLRVAQPLTHCLLLLLRTAAARDYLGHNDVATVGIFGCDPWQRGVGAKSVGFRSTSTRTTWTCGRCPACDATCALSVRARSCTHTHERTHAHSHSHARSLTLEHAQLARLVDANTRLVAVGMAANSIGTVNDIRHVCNVAREHGDSK